MKNVSNEFKNIIKSGGPFYAYASITLKNGKKLTLDSDNDFFISGNGYTEDGGDGFPLGSALSKSVTLVIDNIDERFSKYDFYYAQISLFTEADIENRSYDIWRDVKGEEILDINGNTIMLTKSRIGRLNEGAFTVLEPTAVGDTIELVGYDSMYKADADFTSKLSYPTTAGQLLREACSTCNIMLGSPKFNNDDFVIEQAPDKVTCREVIGYIAMLAVGNAVIQDGTLVIKSYDFSAISKIASRADLVEDAGYSILMDYQSDPDISTDPVVITGIATTKKVENESTILIRGTDDYALEITNPLIEGHEDDAINLIGDVLIGVKLRGFSGEFFPDPTIEFMDLACVVDRKDKVYPTFITSLEFNYLGSSSFSCGIKDPERQKSTYYSEATKVYEKAKKEIKQNKTEFEAAVDNLNKTLENASGMYSTESPQPDGSMITYIHDKPTVEESKNVIKVTSEAIGISSDGGKTYPYGLFLTGDLITRILYAIGINADYINSGSLTIKDKNGNITFYADTETGRVTINAESISITGKSVEDISNGIVDDFVTNIYKTDMDEIKNSVRNKIETWYQDSDPSVNWGGTVEMAWCDVNGESILDVNGNEIILLYEESKAEHEGDLWKDLSTNDEYIYRGGQWMKMQVPDEVFDEIDGKAQIFINTPVPPYRVGDLWFDADTQELLTCVESRDKGSCVKSDWQKKNKYTDDSGLNTFISAVYDPKIAELQSQIDGQIETWFYDHEPSLQNEPAVNWTTNEQRKDHEGDLFFWKSTGYSYRFLQDGAVWKWQIVQDTDISKALAAAEKAQDTADHKRRVFVVTPQPPYDIGDLWVQGDDGDIMRCCVARSESASFSASDWEKASKYTDDTRANEVQKELETVNKDLQNQIDGKIETYNQSADPAASWTTAELKAKHTGDLWYNSKTEETMRWNGSAWSKLSDADAKAAKNLAVTKKRVFSVTPYPPYDTDDLWVQGTNGDLMRCVTSRQSGEYVASDWVKATKYTDDSAINNFVKNTYAADLENIKNQIDQKIETWFQPTDPSLNWTGKETQPLCDINGNDILDVSGKNITITVETEKATHEGDLWKNSKTGDEYIYRSGNWEKMPVPDSVFDEIDGKAQIFSTQPKPPYSVDDLYFTGNDILVCLKDRETGEYVASDWQKKDNYTDDSTVTDFIENIYDPKIEDIQNQIDGKIDTYYCDYEPANSNHPASEWTTAYERQKHVGDLFFWKNKGFTYRYMKVDTSYQWVRVKDADIVSAMETASKAQDTADGKRRNFITTPVPPYDVGDLWTQGNDGDLMRCQTARTSGNFVSSDWVKATKYTDDSAVDKLNKSLTSEEVFNRLTDNGKKQGIYMQGDQLYINFSYGKGGTLTLGGVNNENGSIQILDAIGAEVGKWDKDGLNIQKGSIYGSTIYLDKEKAYALIVGRNNSKEIFTIGSMGMHIDNTNMGLLASDSMVVDLMGGWFHGLRMKASNNGRGYGSSISPECFSIGWAEDLQGWSDAMSTVKSYTFSISENSTGCLSIRINGSSYINDYVDISPREIKTTGTKNRVVPTENYSNRLQYCYETASPMFGDIGEGITDENGECIVEIGDIFTETVTTRIEYQVFLQKEVEGDLWIEKKEENYFIVHGTPNLKFAWELKAKQKDYEYVNLEEDVDREEKLPESPENILNAELETLIKEQEELLNETA
jgi:phage-related protein